MITEEKTKLEEVVEQQPQMDNLSPRKSKWSWLIPAKLLTYEKIYWLWLPMILISFLGVIISFLNLEYKQPFVDGSFYCTFITVMCPYVLEFFVELKVKKKSAITQKFTFFKITCIAIAICHIVFSALLIGKPLSQNIIFEIAYIIISLLITLYIYLVFKMDNHPEYLIECMDVPYDEVLKKQRNELFASASQTNSATVNGVKIDI